MTAPPGPAGPQPQRLRLPLTQPQATAQTTVLRWLPAGQGRAARRAGLVLGHGAGTRVDHPLLAGVAARLAGRGWPVTSFNFAYSQLGRRGPDPPARLESAFRDAVALAGGLDQGPLVLGGRSMGGRIASQIAAKGERCAGLALLGYPLHPAGRPQRLRSEHWPELAVPVLLVQGDRDALCDLGLLERERRLRLTGAPSRLHVIEGADHSFRVRGRDQALVLDEVAGAMAGWLETLP